MAGTVPEALWIDSRKPDWADKEIEQRGWHKVVLAEDAGEPVGSGYGGSSGRNQWT